MALSTTLLPGSGGQAWRVATFVSSPDTAHHPDHGGQGTAFSLSSMASATTGAASAPLTQAQRFQGTVPR
ncbi:P2X Purinoceptor 1 [Manis pentadactyla]|nr:P2X Purinoceptor 1 [Manis pentadactyla]